MMFDSQITAVGMDVLMPEPDAEGNYPDAPLTLAVAVGLLLPTPQGPMPIQAGIIRIPIAPKVAAGLGEQLISAAEQMPEEQEKSDLVVASPADMANVAKQADVAASLKGKKK